MNLFTKLPSAIVYEILTYIPFCKVSQKILEKNQYQMKLYNKIKKFLLIQDYNIYHDIFRKYNGELEYVFENDEIYLYVEYNVKTDELINYIFIG